MVASAPVIHGSELEMISSPDAGTRGFIAVNHASSNESSASSRLSSPQDHSQKPSGHPPLAHGGMYPQLQGQEHAGHKRKRSSSDDPIVFPEQRPYDYSPPRKPEPQHMANRALNVLGGVGHNVVPYYQNGVKQHNGHTWHSERPAQSHPPGNGIVPNTSEAQMVGALQQEPNVSEAQPRPWEPQPMANGQTMNDQYSQDDVSVVTSVAPKRKRNFSNRTKTGCLTCRTRKKKCDEGQPVCNNCLRGGFNCRGYSGDVSEPPTYTDPQMETPHPNRPPVHLEGGQARPITIDDNDGQPQPPYGSSTPRNEPQNRPPYPGQQQWPSQQTQSSYTSEHLPPLSDVNRPEQPLSARSLDMSRPPTQGTSYPPHPQPPHQGQPPVQMQYPPQHVPPQTAGPSHPPPGPPPPGPPPPSGPPPQQPNQWHQPNYQPAYPPSSSHNMGPTHSRMPSSGFERSKTPFKVSSQEDVEKSKMLRSVQYNHFDPTLTYERQRCERALDRYQAACKLDSGLAEQEIRNLLLKVVDASQDTTHKFPSQNHSKGHIGHGVKIEAPFTCTYGYNLKIQDDVYVGKGCNFDDAGTIEIGPRSIIAPGVTILTTEYGTDLVHRKGTKGFWVAGDVVIASGVVIGARSIIYPGVRIDDGVTVEAGAVVRESLKANQIYRAYPAQVVDMIPRQG